jgi:signal transduction histidine kinase
MNGSELPHVPGADSIAPVRHHGELLGALTIAKRRGESVTPMEQKLIDDLAHQAGLVLKNVGLTAELLERLEELRASRQRLVAAQDAERRRLERNLHDGAQQHLVALKVKARAGRRPAGQRRRPREVYAATTERRRGRGARNPA